MSRETTTGAPSSGQGEGQRPAPDEALRDALEAALTRVAAGATRAEALAAADPAQREALAGLLAAAELTGSAETPPSPTFAARGRADLEARLAAAPRTPLPLPRRRPSRRLVLRGLGALAASVLFLIGLGVASANAGPGDWLYPLHEAWERSETRIAAWLGRGDDAGAAETTPESGAREGGAPDAADGASVREKDETSGPEASEGATGSRDASARAMRDRTAVDDATESASLLPVGPSATASVSATGLVAATSTSVAATSTVAPTLVAEVDPTAPGSGDPPRPEPQDPRATEPPPSATTPPTTPPAETATPSATAPPPSAASATPSPTATDAGPAACVVRDGRIEGVVTWPGRRPGSREPASGAQVEALPPSLGGPATGGVASTDADGHYAIEGLCEGAYTLRARVFDAAGTVAAEAWYGLDPSDPNATPSPVEIGEDRPARTGIDIELPARSGAGPTPTQAPSDTPPPATSPAPTSSPTAPPRIQPTDTATPTPSPSPTPGRAIGP